MLGSLIGKIQLKIGKSSSTFIIWKKGAVSERGNILVFITKMKCEITHVYFCSKCYLSVEYHTKIRSSRDAEVQNKQRFQRRTFFIWTFKNFHISDIYKYKIFKQVFIFNQMIWKEQIYNPNQE